MRRSAIGFGLGCLGAGLGVWAWIYIAAKVGPCPTGFMALGVGFLTGGMVLLAQGGEGSRPRAFVALGIALLGTAIANHLVMSRLGLSFMAAVVGIHGEGIVFNLPFLILGPSTAWVLCDRGIKKDQGRCS